MRNPFSWNGCENRSFESFQAHASEHTLLFLPVYGIIYSGWSEKIATINNGPLFLTPEILPELHYSFTIRFKEDFHNENNNLLPVIRRWWYPNLHLNANDCETINHMISKLSDDSFIVLRSLKNDYREGQVQTSLTFIDTKMADSWIPIWQLILNFWNKKFFKWWNHPI